MCSKEKVKKVLTDPAGTIAETGTAASGAGGALDEAGTGLGDIESVQPSTFDAAAQADADEETAEDLAEKGEAVTATELARRRRLLAGGRSSTILTSGLSSPTTQNKTLLGQ